MPRSEKAPTLPDLEKLARKRYGRRVTVEVQRVNDVTHVRVWFLQRVRVVAADPEEDVAFRMARAALDAAWSALPDAGK